MTENDIMIYNCQKMYKMSYPLVLLQNLRHFVHFFAVVNHKVLFGHFYSKHFNKTNQTYKLLRCRFILKPFILCHDCNSPNDCF